MIIMIKVVTPKSGVYRTIIEDVTARLSKWWWDVAKRGEQKSLSCLWLPFFLYLRYSFNIIIIIIGYKRLIRVVSLLGFFFLLLVLSLALLFCETVIYMKWCKQCRVIHTHTAIHTFTRHVYNLPFNLFSMNYCLDKFGSKIRKNGKKKKNREERIMFHSTHFTHRQSTHISNYTLYFFV